MKKLFAFQSATILDNLLSLVCIQIDLFNFEGKETHQLLFEMVETLECWSFHIEKAICIRLSIATSISIFQAHFEWFFMHRINYLLVLKMSLHFWLSWIKEARCICRSWICHITFSGNEFQMNHPEPRKKDTTAA